MIKDIRLHKIEYIALIAYMSVSSYLIYVYRTNEERFKILVFMASYYLMWSLMHHIIMKRLSITILLEYILIALLGFVSLTVIF